MSELRVRVVQADPLLGDIARNTERLRGAVDQAQKDEVDLLVFPEMYLSGYQIAHADPVPSMISRTCRDAIDNLAPHTTGLTVVVGTPLMEDDMLYNAAVILDDGSVHDSYAKTHLYDTETKLFHPGDELPVFSTTVGDLGILICYDCEFPESARALAANGAETLVSIWCNMRPFEEHHQVYARARAMENGIPHVVCNRVGSEGDLDFFGRSQIVNQYGDIIDAAQVDDEAVLTATIEPTMGSHSTLSYLEDRRTDLY